MAKVSLQFHRLGGQLRPVIGTGLYGLVARLAAVAFQLSIHWMYTRCYRVPAGGGFRAALDASAGRHSPLLYDLVKAAARD